MIQKQAKDPLIRELHSFISCPPTQPPTNACRVHHGNDECRIVDVYVLCRGTRRLTTETIKGTALSLESIDDIKGGDGLALGMLGISDGITDDAFEEGLEDTTGFFIDH